MSLKTQLTKTDTRRNRKPEQYQHLPIKKTPDPDGFKLVEVFHTLKEGIIPNLGRLPEERKRDRFPTHL